MLQGKVIVIGICGGIAAYKIADVVSQLKKLKAEVHVIMTRAATKFITPLTLSTLSQNAVYEDLFWESGDEPNIHHIELAHQADVILIAPATANMIGKIAHGIADDLLSTTVMAATGPVMLAPSMNVHMYENAIVQENLYKLRNLGYQIIEPEAGHLACGDTGRGRLPETERIVKHIVQILQRKQDLSGRQILITAGGTREALDPVRYLSNRSTGKMGYAIARIARDRGAEVVLISAPTWLDAPVGVTVIPVLSARDMYEAVMEQFPACDVVIKAAAVADYRPRMEASNKIKKEDANLFIELERNPDILRELGQIKDKQILVGFAAETQNPIESGMEKIVKKNLDFIVINDVTREGAGFATDTNIVTLVFPDGRKVELPQLLKEEVAERILDEVVTILSKRENK